MKNDFLHRASSVCVEDRWQNFYFPKKKKKEKKHQVEKKIRSRTVRMSVCVRETLND